MNESETAEFYEKRSGDTSLWEKEPSNVDVRKGESVVFSFRLTVGELKLLRQTAKQRGVNVSELIRSAALREVQEEERPFTYSTTILDLGGLSTSLFQVSVARQSFGSEAAALIENDDGSMLANGRRTAA